MSGIPVKARIGRIWRLIATGAALTAFGTCGLLFSVLLFPIAWLWPHRRSSQRVVAAVIHRFFRALVLLLQWVGVMRLDVSGGAAFSAREPAIIVANHPTYLDVMVLLALVPRACCVVKNVHWGNPCFWGIVRAAQYVSNADPSELIEAGARQLAAGYTMIIFPEGTRSPGDDRLHPFSRGFAHMALQAGIPIRPVLIDCDPPAFTKRMRWYHVPPRPFRMRIVALESLELQRIAAPDAPHAAAARVVAKAVQAHITEHLFAYGFFKTGN
ncbi:lysophospholipid acyltransferase family protein [Trinickia sp.]|uniref:lysophospholipid acyltransferase family protein n=1 Tax=Trinickia sp. TaxID=2571163 RepID=UPI003F811930